MCVGPPWTRRTRWWRIWSLARPVWAAPSGSRQLPKRHGSLRRRRCFTGATTTEEMARQRWEQSQRRVLVLAKQTECVATHTCVSRSSKHGPSEFGAMCTGCCRPCSSSEDEATHRNTWNAFGGHGACPCRGRAATPRSPTRSWPGRA